jgi:hypothetical protein
MKGRWFRVWIGLLGVVLVQCLAMTEMGLRLDRWREAARAAREAGYQFVPGESVLMFGSEVATVFWSGMFLSLTVGVLVTAAGIVAAVVVRQVWSRRHLAIGVVVLLWLLGVSAVNANGFNWLASGCGLVVPLIFGLEWRYGDGFSKKRRLVALIRYWGWPLFGLMLIWSIVADASFSVGLRERLLQTGWPGERLVAVYYRYAYFPAAIMKNLDQKTVKTVRFENGWDCAEQRAIATVLLAHDVLPLTAVGRADLSIGERNGNLEWRSDGRMVQVTTPAMFHSDLDRYLTVFSQRTDRFAGFRVLWLLSVWLVIAGGLYAGLFLILRWWIRSFGSGRSLPVAAMVAFILSAALPWLIAQDPQRDSGQVRSDEVRWSVDDGADPVDDASGEWGLQWNSDDRAITTSISTLPVRNRYDLADRLGQSRQARSLPVLLSLMEDPHPLVVATALRSIAKRGDPAACTFILERMDQLDHWYIQEVAYHTLKRLGWRQPASISLPSCSH